MMCNSCTNVWSSCFIIAPKEAHNIRQTNKEKIIIMEFASQLKHLRTAAGLSQEEIAQKVHVTRQSVSKWEAGDSSPDLETTAKLAEFFDVSLDQLVLGKAEASSNDISNKKLLKKIKELEEERNEHSLASFLEENWFSILIAITIVYAGFHGGVRYWWDKFF